MAKESNAEKNSPNNTPEVKDEDFVSEDAEEGSDTGKSVDTKQKRIQIFDSPTFSPFAMSHSFQGLSSIPKLKGSENWEAWVKALESVARLNGVWNVFTGAMKKPTEPNIDENDTNYDVKMDRYERQTEKYLDTLQRSTGLMQMILDEGPESQLGNLKDAEPHLQMEFLKGQYEVTGYTAIHQALVKLWTHRSSADYASPTEFADEVKKAKTKLKDMGKPLPDFLWMSIFLHGLGDAYQDFITQMLNVNLGKDEKGNQIELSLEYVVKQLIQRELRASATNTTSADNAKGLKTDTRGGAKQQGKGGSENKRNRSRKPKDDQDNAEDCGHCKSKTHTSERCFFEHPDLAYDKWKEHHKDELAEYQKAKKAKKDKAKAKKAKEEEPAEKKNEKRSLMARAGAAHTEPKDSCWYMDSAASTHMTYDLTEFSGPMKPSSQFITLADGSKIKAQGVGTVTLMVKVDGVDTEIDIVNVQYSPQLDSKLISLGTLEKKGYYFIGRNGQLKLYDKDDIVLLEGTRTDEVYLVNQPGVRHKANRAETNEFAGKAASMELWHRRLAHVNNDDLRKLPKLAYGIDSTDLGGGTTTTSFCQPCALGKAHRQPSRRPMTRAKKPGYRLTADLAGGGNTLTTDRGNRYFIIIVDDFTRYKWFRPMAKKSQALKEVKAFITAFRNNHNVTVSKFRSDGGGEFVAMKAYFEEEGIQWEVSVPDNQAQNGVSERSVRTVVEKARTMLIASGLPPRLWAEAINCAVYISNRLPTSALKNSTPYEALEKEKPELGHIRVFGSDAYVYDEKAKSKGKMAPRAWIGKLVGYKGIN